MSIPRRQRQWDIYRANLGEGPDVMVLVVSSDETNDILESQVVSCELVSEGTARLPATPVTIRAAEGDSGLPEPVFVTVATLASLPRNCLVSLEGRLESAPLRLAVLRAIDVLVGAVPWP